MSHRTHLKRVVAETREMHRLYPFTKTRSAAAKTARRLQHNPEPVKVVDVPLCTGCRKRAPWCSCGKQDYRLAQAQPAPKDLSATEGKAT